MEGRSEKGLFNVRDINKAEDDPYRALAKAFDYLKSVLDRADNRGRPAADGWRWAVINVIDALAVAIDRGDPSDGWFRDRRHWRLNPDGWAPLVPVVKLFRRLSREDGTTR
jgi:hypothetical protein